MELEQVFGRDIAAAVRALNGHRAAGRDQEAGELGRGIGMGDAASDGPPVADRDMGDVVENLADQRIGRVRPCMGLQLAVPRHRADADGPALHCDPLERRDLAQIDQPAGGRKAEIHRRDQALPAGERARGLIGGERRHRRLDGLGRDVVEQRGLHSAASAVVSAHQPASGSCQPSGQSIPPAARAAST